MDTTLSDPLVDRLLDGRYAVRSRIARGGMASVYLATDTRLDRRVAVKVMHPGFADDPEFVARFTREARAAAALNHPDVVSVYDQGTDGGHPFLVMEYVPGETLRSVLRSRGRLSPAEAVAVMDHVLAALAAAHAAGLVHSDVKPENVLVTPDGRVKVADFGLARAVAASTVTASTATLIGTAAYLAPEQVRDGASDARTDVYSAGVMFFELLTGEPPFSGDSPMSIAFRHTQEDVPAPSSYVAAVPPEIDAVVRAATARDAAARPADAGALHRMLLEVRDRLGLHAAVPAPEPAYTASNDTLVVERTQALATAPPEQPPAQPAGADRSGRRRRRWPLVVAVLTAAAVAAAFAGWYLAVGRYTSTPTVVGLSRPAAEAKLKAAGLHAKWLPSVYSDTIAPHLVAVEDPKAGHDLRKGSAVSLRLSLGRDHVPDVRGDTVDAATAALAKAQLKLGVTQNRYSDTVARNHVITSSPKPGAAVSPGTEITLVVSQGPSPVTLPDVRGKQADQATSILQALGLSVTTTQKYDDKIPAGTVIDSNPPAGTTVHKGDSVGLIVSKGPELVPVPDVLGMQVDDAKKLLETAGFKVKISALPTGPGRVLSESPSGGSMQKRGSTVHLYVF